MTIVDGKYPNKKDLTPRVEKIDEEKCAVEGVVVPDELPLADPADSDSSVTFRENAQDETGEHKPSAYSQNKSPSQNYHDLTPGEKFPYGDQEEYNRKYNHEAHDQWNEHKNIKKQEENPS
ncbi:hypothetical protein CSV63_11390 [Sporosarcina sp. P34]|uniref:hypothetical protein n=1 Tax=Sporosarcina sp. P34 TaxID=2048247 RepID=UPI000C1685CC|nr:hypothetical protein [Sporosarcina sp. P34]PID14690.1 hypothetical protein CSV63_11390 [Sporosarcina sp. P34]